MGRIGPAPTNQPPVPAQQRFRRDEPAHPQRSEQQPGQAGEHRPVGPIQLLVSGSAAATPRPPGPTPTTRHPSKPKNARATPSSRSGEGRSARASLWPQARDAASCTTFPPANLQTSHQCLVLETQQDVHEVILLWRHLTSSREMWCVHFLSIGYQRDSIAEADQQMEVEFGGAAGDGEALDCDSCCYFAASAVQGDDLS